MRPPADGRRSGNGVGPDHHASARTASRSAEPRRHDPDRRRRTDPAHHGAAQVHRRPASVRLLQRRQLLDAQHRQPVPGAHPVSDGQLRERRRRTRTSCIARCSSRRSPSYDTVRQVTPSAAAGAGRSDHGARFPARDGGGERLSAHRRRPRALHGRPSRSPPASSRTTRTIRRSAIRRFEEYGTTRRICATGCCWRRARLLAGWPKMPGERDCYARFEKEWIRN